MIDYITGVMCAIADKTLSSEVGFKGICRKVLVFLLVGIANVLDVQVIGTGSVLRTAVIFFYISNEGGEPFGKCSASWTAGSRENQNGATTITSDDKGHAVSIAIPYGTYVVVESKTPHNMKTIKPFEVKISENHPDKPQTWRVFLDREFTAKLRVIKKDSDTKQTVLVPNAEFKIFNIDKNEYVKQYTTYPSKVEHTSFFTDDDGDLILPEALKIGNYRIEEVSAPYGYVVNDKYVSISVDTDTAFETDGDTNDAIITVEYSDAPAVGEMTVEKKGEVLDGFKGGLLASSYEKEYQN